jgi:hypothetical protein
MTRRAASMMLVWLLALGALARAGAEETMDPRFARAYAQLICSAEMMTRMKPLMTLKRTLARKKLSAEGSRFFQERMNAAWDKTAPAIQEVLDSFGVSRSDLESLARDENRTAHVAAESWREATRLCHDRHAQGDVDLAVRLAIRFGARR